MENTFLERTCSRIYRLTLNTKPFDILNIDWLVPSICIWIESWTLGNLLCFYKSSNFMLTTTCVTNTCTVYVYQYPGTSYNDDCNNTFTKKINVWIALLNLNLYTYLKWYFYDYIDSVQSFCILLRYWFVLSIV